MEKFNRNKYYQGKSEENYKTSAEIVFWCAIAIFGIIVVYFFSKIF